MTQEEKAAAVVAAWLDQRFGAWVDGESHTGGRQIIETLIANALKTERAEGLEQAARLLCMRCEQGVPVVFAGGYGHHKFKDDSTGYCPGGEMLALAQKLRGEQS